MHFMSRRVLKNIWQEIRINIYEKLVAKSSMCFKQDSYQFSNGNVQIFFRLLVHLKKLFFFILHILVIHKFFGILFSFVTVQQQFYSSLRKIIYFICCQKTTSIINTIFHGVNLSRYQLAIELILSPRIQNTYEHSSQLLACLRVVFNTFYETWQTFAC